MYFLPVFALHEILLLLFSLLNMVVILFLPLFFGLEIRSSEEVSGGELSVCDAALAGNTVIRNLF